MKIKVEVDCTPIEARKFLGLPDVEPLQEAMMNDLQERMTKNMAYLEPEALAKAWFPIGAQGLEQFQRLFMNAAMSAGRGKDEASGKDEDDKD